MQGEDNKNRGGRRQGAAANAWGDHDTGSKSQSDEEIMIQDQRAKAMRRS